MDVTDITLIQRTLSGDKQAFVALFDRHYALLYSLAFSILRDRDRVQDVLQDGFIQIYQHLGSLKNPAKFRAWAYTIIKRQCLGVVKELRSGPINISDLTESEKVKYTQSLSSDTTTADLMHREQSGLIRQAVYQLPLKYREVAVLFFLEDKKYQDIADILGITYFAAEKRLIRAKQKLQAQLKELIK